MSMWSKFTAWLSGWPESKEARIQNYETYAEERRDQKRKELKKKKIRKQGNLK